MVEMRVLEWLILHDTKYGKVMKRAKLCEFTELYGVCDFVIRCALLYLLLAKPDMNLFRQKGKLSSAVHAANYQVSSLTNFFIRDLLFCKGSSKRHSCSSSSSRTLEH